MFFAKRGDSLHMMTGVLREIASRNFFSPGHDIVRVRVTIEGWCVAKTYDLCTDGLKRLLMVEEIVKEKQLARRDAIITGAQV